MMTLPKPTPAVLPNTPKTISAKEAASLILSGRAPAGLQVKGHLDLSKKKHLRVLPPGLRVDSLDLTGCTALRFLPQGLQARRIDASGCKALAHIPAGLRCYDLNLADTAVAALPADLQIAFRLDLTGCTQIERLPENLKVGSLILQDCTALEALPEGLEVSFLDLSGCLGLQEWPQNGAVRVGRLNARNCFQLTTLPDWVAEVAQLDLVGCANLTELPAHLRVTSWIDVANTGLQALPEGVAGAQVRWRGIAIDQRIAFQPETITAREVMYAENVELRRVLMERMGYEEFLKTTYSEKLDRDRDAGGERELVRVPFGDDEPLVCLSVRCPSTGRHYMLRVPPTTRTCRQAAAWLAGFDNERDYHPLAET